MSAWLLAIGLALDKLLCAILTGQKDTTLSMASANGELKHIWAACVFCKFLNVIQKNHCANQRAGLPMSEADDARAFFGLVALATFLFYAARCTIQLVVSLF